jgi:hypothetical protein
VNEQSAGSFVQVVRLCKYWRDRHFSEESRPKSIILTTLLARHIRHGSNDIARTFVIALERLSAELNAYPFVPVISNPSLAEENLARDWKLEHYRLLRERLGGAAKTARRAYELAERNERDASIREWISLFGEKFPKMTEADGEKLRTARSIASVAPSGRILFAPEPHGVAIQPHRFYGQENPKTK